MALKELTGPIRDWYKTQKEEKKGSTIGGIVSDFFLGWTRDLAEELGIPRLTFCPSGAFGTSEFYTLWRDAPRNPNPGDPGFGVRFPGIPGEPVIPWWQVSHVYRGVEGKGEEGREEWEFFRDCVRKNLESDATIINSFEGFERAFVEYLKREMGNERVWTVGPLLPVEEEDLNSMAKRGGENSVPTEEVLEWLDRRKACSVLYVCFGSRASLSGDQLRALAAALESSGVDFVWAFRESDRANAGTIPEGFEDRVEGRGLVIRGWAPQLAILRRSATAAFLTHCGWNSVLESIAAGVMMVGWPQGADQFVDARLIQEVGAGLKVRVDGPENVPGSEELARLLKESVREDRPERIRVRELQVAAKVAVKEGGSSHKNLEQLVSYLRQLKN